MHVLIFGAKEDYWQNRPGCRGVVCYFGGVLVGVCLVFNQEAPGAFILEDNFLTRTTLLHSSRRIFEVLCGRPLLIVQPNSP